MGCDGKVFEVIDKDRNDPEKFVKEILGKDFEIQPYQKKLLETIAKKSIIGLTAPSRKWFHLERR